MSNPLREYAIIRLSARVRGLLAGRLPTDSANCIVEAFSAAADGDVEKADDLITRAQTLSVAQSVVRLVEGPAGG